VCVCVCVCVMHACTRPHACLPVCLCVCVCIHGASKLTAPGLCPHPPTRAHTPSRRRPVPGNLYRDKQGADPDASCNELVIRIQPKEAIYLKINNKVRRRAGALARWRAGGLRAWRVWLCVALCVCGGGGGCVCMSDM
jgi:hypothetical protein